MWNELKVSGEVGDEWAPGCDLAPGALEGVPVLWVEVATCVISEVAEQGDANGDEEVEGRSEGVRSGQG